MPSVVVAESTCADYSLWSFRRSVNVGFASDKGQITMSKSPIDQEMDAIKTITAALDPLPEDARRRVLEYATSHLGINVSPQPPSRVDTYPPAGGAPRPRILDIRTLRDQKNPRSDIQMAAIVAYYLTELAPVEDRKTEIDKDDIVRYFKQAGYPLPTRASLTLNNAKVAGYLDGMGQGKFRLNPVGYNLVAHNLPQGGGESVVGGGRAPRKKAPRGKRATRSGAKGG